MLIGMWTCFLIDMNNMSSEIQICVLCNIEKYEQRHADIFLKQYRNIYGFVSSLIFIFRNWIGSSLSFVLAFSISIIEILVAILQAYIFTVLSALYFGFAVQEDDH